MQEGPKFAGYRKIAQEAVASHRQLAHEAECGKQREGLECGQLSGNVFGIEQSLRLQLDLNAMGVLHSTHLGWKIRSAKVGVSDRNSVTPWDLVEALPAEFPDAASGGAGPNG